MTSRILVAACSLAALGVGACGGAQSAGPKPGQYQQVIKITDLEFPGMTADSKKQTAAQMEQSAGGGTGGMYCITKRDKGEQDWQKSASGMAKSMGGTCTQSKNVATETELDVAMACTGTPQGDVGIVIKAKAHSEGYDGTMSFDINHPSTGEKGKIAMTITAKRVGDCPA